MELAEASGSLIGVALEGRYRLVREIGRGGMGVVYEAEHVQLGKRVAVKMMLEKYAQDRDAVVRFEREALAASRIGNPHIIDVSHIGSGPGGRPFVVMELLTGAPLSAILEQTGPMEPWRAIDIMRQVLRAVGAAHAKGIIHRDLKPDNIFLVNHDDQHDFVKLLDFGISKVMGTDELVAATRLTTTGMVMGTPLYMAPEQAMGSEIDHQADIYALGVILYEMLAGKPPFDGTSYPVLVAKLLTATPPHLSDVRKGLPPKLADAVHRALEKEPTARFTSAETFASALPRERRASHAELELAGTLGPDSGMRASAVTMKTRRRPWVWAVAGAVLVAAATVTIVVTVGGRHPDADAGATPPAAAAAPRPELSPAPPPPPPAGSAEGTRAGSSAPALGHLEVRSIPDGATVTVDGTVRGTTPVLVELPVGRHHVHVERAGFGAVDEDEELRATERTSAVITLQPATKTVGPKPPKPAPRLELAGSARPAHEPPKVAPPDVAPPRHDPPRVDPPKTDPAQVDPPKVDPPRHEPPKHDPIKPGGGTTKPNPY